MSCLPLMLPIEIRFRILTHLHLTLSASLLGSLNHSLQSALDDLCDSCKAYNLRVYGPNVSDWPEIRVTGGCWCAKIGGHQRPEIARARDRWNSDACVDAKIRSPLADYDPPPYFIFHLRQVAATYLSTTSPSLYTREIEAMLTSRASAKEVDALVWKVLRHFQCCVAPSKTRAWKLEDELCIIPISERPSEGSSDDEILCALQLALDLNRHRDFVSHSKLNPRNMMLTPPLISNSPGLEISHLYVVSPWPVCYSASGIVFWLPGSDSPSHTRIFHFRAYFDIRLLQEHDAFSAFLQLPEEFSVYTAIASALHSF
ncbi:uncharacterized protein F5891DRAFT_1184020 [Suillus fuscotomentosus]|uniref:Uncharacterized protein n=1 Tax=Suillus fuscotomentosus TaxID=1912939 RepID=A0AAD4EE65_9AGAM|nr:uncharacterized protein F5891DRAFT_1184020 [Suillus fuscotomentosus]KAG1904599.1 hypothetical protein F5891DRAFT_1184020 [Suillus fuscotomentosus]